MKRTQYFENVEAVNQYYPDGVPSTVIAIVGDGSNVFVSSDNAASGNQQYYNAEMTNDDIVAEQVSAAESQGYETGYAAGETAGYEAGYAAGEAAGGTSLNWMYMLYENELSLARQILNVPDMDSTKMNAAWIGSNSDNIPGKNIIDNSVAYFVWEASNASESMSSLESASAITIGKLIKIHTNTTNNVQEISYAPIYASSAKMGGTFIINNTEYGNSGERIIYGTVNLEQNDEVIMVIAFKSTVRTELDLFGYDESLQPYVDEESGETVYPYAPFKAETAGTYTFGMYVSPGEYSQLFVTSNFTAPETVIQLCSNDISKRDMLDYKVRKVLTSSRNGIEIDDTHYYVSNDVWFEEQPKSIMMNTTTKSFSLMDSHTFTTQPTSQANFTPSILYVSVISKDNFITNYVDNTGTYDGSDMSEDYPAYTLGYTWTTDFHANTGDLIKVVYNSGMTNGNLQQASNLFFTKTFIAPETIRYRITIEQKYAYEEGFFDNQITLSKLS